MTTRFIQLRGSGRARSPRSGAGSEFTPHWRVGSVALVCALALLAGVSLADKTFFTEDFDTRATGLLHNQNEWVAHRQNDAQVQAATKYAGSKAALVATNAVVWRNFSDTTATNVWIDFYAYVTHPTDNSAPSLDGSVAGAFFVGTNGVIHALSNTTWVATATTVRSNSWRRFTVNLDYATSNWALHVASDIPNAIASVVATNLKFSSSSTNAYFKTFRIRN
ncbi:MAG: hypothetical protein HN919_01465 [Verrucomicrobia bacterium]|jgi:hypothetical protein|nr:hypothetical protein [Verrucomicrobiota bacterium]MBT7064945.1 hypothetical protein [Verrucomicrobiota bacterium]MBT7700691.1 hypothetical protein [Verrucomicrobiota bacterium]